MRFASYVKVVLLLVILSPTAMAKTNILILGDSLSASYQMAEEEGWVSLLYNRLQKCESPYTVTNLSESGDTTLQGLTKLQASIERLEPDIVVVELGGNDGLRGHPPVLIKKNLSKIIDLSLENKAQVLLVEMRIPPNYGQQYTQRFFENYQELAEEYNIRLIPFPLEEIALNKELMNPDGIHPNAKAQPLIADVVAESLEPLIDESTFSCLTN